MSLTPNDVRKVTFRKPSIGKRGYDAEEVDAFLEEAETELGRLLAENQRLRGQAERGFPDTGPGAAADAQHEIRDARARLQYLLVEQAKVEHDLAELARAHAQASAQRAENASDEQGGQVLLMAQRTAEQHLSDARREAEAALSEAQTRAGELLTEAEADARSRVEVAQQRHVAVLDEIEETRRALQAQVKSVAEFGRNYHEALRTDVERRMPDMAKLLMPESPPPAPYFS